MSFLLLCGNHILDFCEIIFLDTFPNSSKISRKRRIDCTKNFKCKPSFILIELYKLTNYFSPLKIALCKVDEILKQRLKFVSKMVGFPNKWFKKASCYSAGDDSVRLLKSRENKTKISYRQILEKIYKSD